MSCWRRTRPASCGPRTGRDAEEIDKLSQGGDGHIIVWGGVSLWRSLTQLDLVASNAKTNGVLELRYRRHR
jgi:hypothetical protein